MEQMGRNKRRQVATEGEVCGLRLHLVRSCTFCGIDGSTYNVDNCLRQVTSVYQVDFSCTLADAVETASGRVGVGHVTAGHGRAGAWFVRLALLL